MVNYISLFSKIRCSLTYLPNQNSDVTCECSLTDSKDKGATGFSIKFSIKVPNTNLETSSNHKILLFLALRSGDCWNFFQFYYQSILLLRAIMHELGKWRNRQYLGFPAIVLFRTLSIQRSVTCSKGLQSDISAVVHSRLYDEIISIFFVKIMKTRAIE